MTRTLLFLLAAAAAAPAGDLALVAIRDNVVQLPDEQPQATQLTLDLLGPDHLLETRRIRIRDPKARASLFQDPFLFPARTDLAYLVSREKKGLRVLRISWARGEDLGASFLVPCAADVNARPVHVVSGRIGFLGPKALVSVDLHLGFVVATRLPLRPLDFDPVANRLYVMDGARVASYPLVATDPPEKIESAPNPLFKLPDATHPGRAAVSRDGLRIAYASKNPARRPDARRFLLSVADNRGRLVVRRTVPGRLHDLRWIDDTRVLLTTTDREVTSLHTLDVKTSRLTSRALPARYLAPPEIAPAEPLGLRRQS